MDHFSSFTNLVWTSLLWKEKERDNCMSMHCHLESHTQDKGMRCILACTCFRILATGGHQWLPWHNTVKKNKLIILLIVSPCQCAHWVLGTVHHLAVTTHDIISQECVSSKTNNFGPQCVQCDEFPVCLFSGLCSWSDNSEYFPYAQWNCHGCPAIA